MRLPDTGINPSAGQEAFHPPGEGLAGDGGVHLDEDGRLVYGTIFGKVRVLRAP